MATRKQILDNENNKILPITDTEAVRNPQSIGGTLESRLQNIEEDKGRFKGWFNSLVELKAAHAGRGLIVLYKINNYGQIIAIHALYAEG